VNAKFAFQDRENLFLGLELLTGGSLESHLKSNYIFSEEQTKFIIACIIQG
jgi:serine/threonine protein kinase